MTSVTTVAQSLGVAYAAGINLPATVAVLGISDRAGWIEPLPGVLGAVGSIWMIAIGVGALPHGVPGDTHTGSGQRLGDGAERHPSAGGCASRGRDGVSSESCCIVVAAGLLGGGSRADDARNEARTALRGRQLSRAGDQRTREHGGASHDRVSIAIFIWTHPYITLIDRDTRSHSAHPRRSPDRQDDPQAVERRMERGVPA